MVIQKKKKANKYPTSTAKKLTLDALNSDYSPLRLSSDIPGQSTWHHTKGATPDHFLDIQVFLRYFPLEISREHGVYNLLSDKVTEII